MKGIYLFSIHFLLKMNWNVTYPTYVCPFNHISEDPLYSKFVLHLDSGSF